MVARGGVDGEPLNESVSRIGATQHESHNGVVDAGDEEPVPRRGSCRVAQSCSVERPRLSKTHRIDAGTLLDGET